MQNWKYIFEQDEDRDVDGRGVAAARLTDAQTFSAIRLVACKKGLYDRLSGGITAQQIFKIQTMTEEEKSHMQKNTKHSSMFAILESVEMCADGEEAFFNVQNHSYLGVLMDLNICANCMRYDNIPGTKFQVCSKCKIVHYCSMKCLHEDWPEHRHNCVGCPKRVRVSTNMCLRMGHMNGGFRFDSFEEKNDFFNKGKRYIKRMARISRMKRAINDFILNLLSDHKLYLDVEYAEAGKEKAVSSEYETLIAHQLPKEGVEYFDIGKTSCFYDLMAYHQLTGRVYVFMKTPAKGLQMMICRLDKLIHNFKVYRDKFKAEFLAPRPQKENERAFSQRRLLIGKHYKCMQNHIEQLEGMDREEIIFAFAAKWSDFKFYVLNGNHMLPYGRQSHDAMFERTDLWSENTTSAAADQPRQAAQTQPAPNTQTHARYHTRWSVYEGPIDDELLRMIENG